MLLRQAAAFFDASRQALQVRPRSCWLALLLFMAALLLFMVTVLPFMVTVLPFTVTVLPSTATARNVSRDKADRVGGGQRALAIAQEEENHEMAGTVYQDLGLCFYYQMRYREAMQLYLVGRYLCYA